MRMSAFTQNAAGIARRHSFKGQIMTGKNFDINRDGYSVRCRLYVNDPKAVRRVVVYGHGFGGHKETKAAERFAVLALSKHKDMAVVVFDWPCHGEDARKNLQLEECGVYLRIVLSYVQEKYQPEEICGYATSFGGYIFLKYAAEHGNPFSKLILRCPAVRMYDVLNDHVLSEEDKNKLAHGKPVLAGFDWLVRISGEFLESIRENDITELDYSGMADSILILHGTKDEIVPEESVRAFAEKNGIEYIPVEKADHRFMDPKLMDLAIEYIQMFLDL